MKAGTAKDRVMTAIDDNNLSSLPPIPDASAPLDATQLDLFGGLIMF